MQNCHDSQDTQVQEHGSLAVTFLFPTPDKTKHPLSQLKTSMHLLLGCLLTSLFEAHPSLLGDKMSPPSLLTRNAV